MGTLCQQGDICCMRIFSWRDVIYTCPLNTAKESTTEEKSQFPQCPIWWDNAFFIGVANKSMSERIYTRSSCITRMPIQTQGMTAEDYNLELPEHLFFWVALLISFPPEQLPFILLSRVLQQSFKFLFSLLCDVCDLLFTSWGSLASLSSWRKCYNLKGMEQFAGTCLVTVL